MKIMMAAPCEWTQKKYFYCLSVEVDGCKVYYYNLPGEVVAGIPNEINGSIPLNMVAI